MEVPRPGNQTCTTAATQATAVFKYYKVKNKMKGKSNALFKKTEWIKLRAVPWLNAMTYLISPPTL